MPTAENDGVSIHYETGGRDDRDAETVVLLLDAGYGPWLWSWQYPALAGGYEVLVPATRGTGRSDAAEPYSVPAMAGDLEAVLADTGVRRVHLVGAGLGGMVALQYALDFSRARTLSLFGTAAGGAGFSLPEDLRDQLAADPDDPAALRRSLEPVAGPDLLDSDGLLDRIAAWRRAEDADPEVRRAHLDAMVAFDASDRLHEVTVPVLVVHGADDRLVPVAAGRSLADRLPAGEFREFPGEHLVFVERSKPVNDALVGFLSAHGDE